MSLLLKTKTIRTDWLSDAAISLTTETPAVASECSWVAGEDDIPADQFDYVYAVGDMHGDYAVLQACLAMTECVDVLKDGTLRWSGGARRAVVLLGDLVDRWRAVYEGGRGPGEFRGEEHALLRACNDLALQAQRAGSAVFRLVGNHELLQMQPGNAYRYASPYSVANDGGAAARTASFAGGEYLEEVGACEARAIVKIGDHVFVHGGINPGVIAAAAGENLVARCNDTLRAFLLLDPAAKAEQLADEGSDVNVLLTRVDKTRDGRSEHAGVLWDDKLSSFSALGARKSDDLQALHRQMLWRDLPPEFSSHEQWVMDLYVTRVLRELNTNLDSPTPATTFVLAHCMQSFGERGEHAPMSRFSALRRLDDYEEMVPAAPGDIRAAVEHSVACIHGGRVWCIDVGQSRAFHAFRKDHMNGVPPGVREEFHRPTLLVIDMTPGAENRHMVRRWARTIVNEHLIQARNAR